MKSNIFNKSSLSILAFFLFSLSSIIFSNPNNISKYQYISPIPNSKMVSPYNKIVLRYGELLSDNLDNTTIKVSGTLSGNIDGKLQIAADKRTILFHANVRYQAGEIISVIFNPNIYTVNADKLPEVKFSFSISEANFELTKDEKLKHFLSNVDFANENFNTSQNIDKLTSIELTNETNFPEITTNNYQDPMDGFIFMNSFNIFNFASPSYLLIVDNSGVPIFYQKHPAPVADFKLQRNGMLSYYSIDRFKFFIMDSSYNVVDSVDCDNGYIADIHEFQVLENGHYLIMAYDPQPVDMSAIVAGGDSNATVTGLIIQELDADKNAVFQWRSWDHIPITDATPDIDLTASNIDYIHGNSIEKDTDGNLLISSRHLDEITKINRQTGDIIWRLGGKQNDFNFINDPDQFSHQHDCRRQENGNITLFDNGNLHSPQYSRGIEYELDENNLTANLVWEFRHNPDYFSAAMGSFQRYNEQVTTLGWGWSDIGLPEYSEVLLDGSKLFELDFPDTLKSYRAYKFNWRTNFFTTNLDSLNFGYIQTGNSSQLSFDLFNNTNENVEITELFHHDSVFTVQNNLPIELNANSHVSITVSFTPQELNVFADTLHIRYDTENRRVAQIIYLSGSSDPSTYINDDFYNDDFYNEFEFRLAQNYPNPFNPTTKIKFMIPTVETGHAPSLQTKLIVFDILGRDVATLLNKPLSAGTHEVEFDSSGLPSGVYFYKLTAGEFTETKKMILLR